MNLIMHLDQTLRTIIENREILVTFILSLIAIIKLTAWGRAQATALDTIIGVVEGLGAVDVKRAVARTEPDLPDAAKDAIIDSVAKADPKKSAKCPFLRAIKELFRGF